MKLRDVSSAAQPKSQIDFFLSSSCLFLPSDQCYSDLPLLPNMIKKSQQLLPRVPVGRRELVLGGRSAAVCSTVARISQTRSFHFHYFRELCGTLRLEAVQAQRRIKVDEAEEN